MRAYLLNPPFFPHFVRCGRWQGVAARGATLYYPIWLSYATGVLQQDFGKHVRLVDAPAWQWNRESVTNDAKKFKPDLVVVETNFSSVKNDIEVIAELKSSAEPSKIVLVGPPASQFPDQILQNSEVDAVARFEYDFTIRDYAKAMEEDAPLGNVLGLSYKEDGRIKHNANRPYISSEDLESIPFVSRVYQEHLNIRDYRLDHTLFPMVQVFTGRGCPNLCTFCSWPVTLMGRQYRARSATSVVDEFEFIVNDLPDVREIFIEDDTFTINRSRIRQICDEIKRRDIHVTWSCNARANLDYESMKLMKRAGCRLLDVGYESGSDEILKNIKKRVTTADSRRFTKDARRAGLMVLADVIIGMPGETAETANQTLRFVQEIKPNIVQYAVATPIPGTEFYSWAKENGYLLVDDLAESIDQNGFQKCIVSYPGFTNRDIEKYVNRGLKEYYLNISFLPTAIRNILRKNGLHEFTGMLRAAKVFLDYVRQTRGGEEETATQH
jgi:anaerobic magnesium-protoporphyrin IX monomethyl ester cyclase